MKIVIARLIRAIQNHLDRTRVLDGPDKPGHDIAFLEGYGEAGSGAFSTAGSQCSSALPSTNRHVSNQVVV